MAMTKAFSPALRKALRDLLGPEARGMTPMVGGTPEALARADEMFPVTAYRGVRRPEHIDRPTEGRGALWASESADLAGDYATPVNELEDGFMAKLRINPSGFLEVNSAGAGFDEIPKMGIGDASLQKRFDGWPRAIRSDEIVDAASERGFPGVVFRDTIDNAMRDRGPQTNYAVIDQSRRRASTAAFDPAKKDSSDLLAGLAAGIISLPMLRAALAERRERRA